MLNLVIELQVERGLEILEEIQYAQSRQSLDSAYLSLTAHCVILETVMSSTYVKTAKHPIGHYALYCQREHASLFSSISTHPVKNCKYNCVYLNRYCKIAAWYDYNIILYVVMIDRILM